MKTAIEKLNATDIEQRHPLLPVMFSIESHLQVLVERTSHQSAWEFFKNSLHEQLEILAEQIEASSEGKSELEVTRQHRIQEVLKKINAMLSSQCLPEFKHTVITGIWEKLNRYHQSSQDAMRDNGLSPHMIGSLNYLITTVFEELSQLDALQA